MNLLGFHSNERKILFKQCKIKEDTMSKEEIFIKIMKTGLALAKYLENTIYK